MTFTYSFRDETGALKSGVLEAGSRSDCFRQLSAMGIIPVKVAEGGKNYAKPAARFSMRSSGSSAKWIAAGVAVVIAALGIWFLMQPGQKKIAVQDEEGRKAIKKAKIEDPKPVKPVEKPTSVKPERTQVAERQKREMKPGETNATPIARRQVWGTESRMEAARARGSRRIFKYDSEAYLGMYAQPGEPVPPTPFDEHMEKDLLKALDEPVVVDMNSDTADVVQFKNIVQGMKEELKEYLKNGGTVKEYLAALDERQQKESNFRSEAYRSVSEACEKEGAEAAYQLWKKVNQHLESQGINPVAKPALLRRKYGRGIDDYREDAAPINQN